MKMLKNVIFTSVLVVPMLLSAQQSSTRYGNQTYYTNGTTSTQYGNQTNYSNGVTATQYGMNRY
jgi:ABC-type oligopeptide transport system substrate-binding subunit